VKTIRLLLGLTSMLMILAIAASPAAAEFEANGNTSQGPYQQKAGTVAAFSSGVPVECATLEKGEWHIQTKVEKFTKVGGITKVTQDLTKHGAHLEITGQFAKCTVPSVGLNATVNSSCALQVVQTGATTFTGSVNSLCTISLTGTECVLSVPAGTQNTGLKEVKDVNITGGQEITSTITGITSTVNAACEALGITGNKTGTFKAVGIAHSEKVI
jgi:hypothetical protein